jgi:hypothetical protein
MIFLQAQPFSSFLDSQQRETKKDDVDCVLAKDVALSVEHGIVFYSNL